MFEANEILTQNNDWITFVFFTIFTILVIIKRSFNERLGYTSILFFSKKYFVTYFNKEQRNIFNWYQFLFVIIQILVISLLFYEISDYVKPTYTSLNFHLFLTIVVGVGFYFVFRFLIGLFLAAIFDLKEIHKKVLYEKINYLNALCLSVLPFLLFFYYTDNYDIIFSKIILIIFSVLLVIRYILVANNNKKLIFSNLLYFILYLCALEIAPLVIILKLTI